MTTITKELIGLGMRAELANLLGDEITQSSIPINSPTAQPGLLSVNNKIASRYNAMYCFQEHASQATACLADGDRVGTMVDLAGGFDATAAATDTTRGTLKLGSNGVAGLPTVEFASTQKLTTASTFWDRFESTGVTIMALCKMGGTNAYRIFCGKNGAQYPYFGFRTRVGGYETVEIAMGSACDAPIYNSSTGNSNDTALAGNASTIENSTVIWGSISAAKILQAGRAGFPITTGVAGSGVLAGGLILGDGGVTGFPTQMGFHELRFYTGVLTQAELTEEASKLMSLGTMPNPLIISDGNSFGTGYYSGSSKIMSSTKSLIRGFLNNTVVSGATINFIDLSVSGQTTTTKLGISPAVLNLVGNFKSYRKVAYILWEATNDMQNAGGNKTAAQAWANTLSLINSAKAAGIRDIFIPTVFVRSAANAGAEFESRRIEYNSLVRGNATSAGATIIDLVRIFPELDLVENITNTSILNDQIHPTPQYYAKINYEFAKAINTKWANVSNTSIQFSVL